MFPISLGERLVCTYSGSFIFLLLLYCFLYLKYKKLGGKFVSRMCWSEPVWSTFYWKKSLLSSRRLLQRTRPKKKKNFIRKSGSLKHNFSWWYGYNFIFGSHLNSLWCSVQCCPGNFLMQSWHVHSWWRIFFTFLTWG